MKASNWSVFAFTCVVATTGLCFAESAYGSDAARRLELKKYAVNEFKASTNHCLSFAKVAEHAATLSANTGQFLEDMRLVIIGSDWHRRKQKRGEYYIGIVTNDTGFKPELKEEKSPQVEHLMAAIYFGKMLPPIGAAVGGAILEARDVWKKGGEYNIADAKLYALGGDIGERLHDRELKHIGGAIRRTICAQ